MRSKEISEDAAVVAFLSEVGVIFMLKEEPNRELKVFLSGCTSSLFLAGLCKRWSRTANVAPHTYRNLKAVGTRPKQQ